MEKFHYDDASESRKEPQFNGCCRKSEKNAENETRLVLVRGPPHRVVTTKNDQLAQF